MSQDSYGYLDQGVLEPLISENDDYMYAIHVANTTHSQRTFLKKVKDQRANHSPAMFLKKDLLEEDCH